MHICFFDIDGTLLLSGGAGQAAMEAALMAEFQTREEPHGISAAGRTDRAIVTDLLTYYGIESDDAIYERFLGVYLSHLPQHLSSRGGAVLPGVEDVLEGLHARDDVRLGLLTGNYARGADAKLRHFGLHHYFQFGGYGDRHTDRADVAREALAAYREHHPECSDDDTLWVIGDTPHDITCGRAIDANVIAVCTGMFNAEELFQYDPDHLFEDFSDVEQILAVFP